MEKEKIFLTGGVHFVGVAKNKITKIIEEKQIDAIFMEGIDDSIFDLKNIRNNPIRSIVYFFKDPFFVLMDFIWLRFVLKFTGKDMKSLGKIGNEFKIPVYSKNIDAKLEEIIDFIFGFFPLGYILPVFFILFLALAYPAIFSPIFFLLSFMLFLSLISIYFIFAILLTTSFRNKKMAENTVKLVKKKNHKSALLYCGYYHVTGIYKLIKEKNVEVEIIN